METEPQDRRQFATWCVRGLIGIPVAGAAFAVLRGSAPALPVHGPDRVSLGKVSDLPESGLSARPIRYRRRIGGRVEFVSDTALVGRSPDGVVALSSRCTHVGCRVTLQGERAEQPILCPCHQATFDQSGTPVEGPAKRPLDRLPIEVEGEGEDAEIFWLRAKSES